MAFGDDLPTVHDIEPASELSDKIQILLNQHDRHLTLGDQFPQHIPASDLLDDIGLDPLGGLIQQQHLRISDHTGRWQAVAAGRRKGRPPCLGHGCKNRKHLADLGGDILAAVHAGLQAHAKVLLHRKLRKDLPSLGHQGKAGLGSLVPGRRVRFRPCMAMLPAEFLSVPMMFFISVVLPTPLRPMMQVTSPGTMSC